MVVEYLFPAKIIIIFMHTLEKQFRPAKKHIYFPQHKTWRIIFILTIVIIQGVTGRAIRIAIILIHPLNYFSVTIKFFARNILITYSLYFLIIFSMHFNTTQIIFI